MAPKNAPGWAHPYRDPSVWYADGGDDPAPDPAPAADPDPEPAPADDWAPPSREEWEEHQEKLRSASAEAANRRKWLKAAGYDPKTGSKLQPDPEPAPAPVAPEGTQAQGLSEADVKRQIDRAVAEAKIEGMRGAKKLAASYFKALSDAGWNGTRLDLIMPLSDFDGADPDDPDDMAERVENVKKLFEEGFTPVKRTRNPAAPSNGTGGSGQNGAPAAKVDTADKKPPAPEPKGWAEQVAERVLRGK